MLALRWNDLPAEVLSALRKGTVIPAHPLALTAERKLDERRQRALSRYYLGAGSGGLAVGVHTTQFAIREVGLYAPVLELAMQTARDQSGKTPIMIAGLAGKTAQAVKEAQTARDLGYHLIILRDACQTHRAEAQEFCMDRLFPRLARVLTVGETIRLIGDGSRTS